MQIIYNLVKLNLNPQFPIMSSSSPILACSKVITTHTFESKHPTSVYSPHRGLINCATFNHTNKVIASCGQDGKIVLVSSQQKQKILAEFHFDGRKQTYGLQDPKYTNVPNVTSPTSVNCCLFSPHSRYIAAGSADNYVKVWQMKNHKDIFLTLKHHNDQISSLAWTKNQQILASSSKSGTIAMHSMKSKSLIQQITLKSQDPINAIRFSEGIDYHRFAACTQSGSIKIWDIQSNRGAVKISDFDNINKVSVTSISFSTFNPVLLVASSIDQNLTFYDISQKKAVKTIATEQPLTAVNFYSDGHTLIAGGMYGGLFIYDLRKPQKPKQKLSGHQTAVKYIDFHKQKQSQYHQPKQSIKSQQNVNSRISRTSGTNSVTKLGNKQVQKRQNEKQPNQENSLQFKREGTSSTRPQTTVIQPRQKQITTTSNIQNSASKTINPVPPIVYNRRTQLGSVPPVSNTTQVNPPLQNNFIPIQKPIKVQRGGGSIKIQGQMQQAFQDLRIKLEDSMSQKMGLIHVQIIRQFQIQQQQIKGMLERTFQQSKQKDRRIKQLEEQIFNMKKSRY